MDALSAISFPKELPICEKIGEIEHALQRYQVVIVKGETGSGKTTQIPKLCLKAGFARRGMIGCTQPRRVAALAVASRLSEELGPVAGKWVGSRIRFSDRTDRQTRIKVMTDGILLNEMQGDPLLRRYSTLVIDEAHERSVNIDFILGHLIQIRSKRPDLKIVITSATIDTARFSEAFGGAPVVEVSGRMYPVEVRYRPFEDRPDGGYTYIEATCDAVADVIQESRSGDLLVFLPSEKDIREVCDRLSGGAAAHCDVLPLYGRMTQDAQQRIFRPGQRRRIVVATNIAETSITVSGIRYVIDSGLARISRFSSHTRTQRLPIEPVSRSSADQRKGRCGRVSEGVCIRLYSQEDYQGRPEFTPPEIHRSNLASVVLRLKAFDFGSVEHFPFIDPPESRAIQGGLQLLAELGALDENGELTEIGRQLAHIPIDPTIARMLLEARKLHALDSVLIIASALSIQDPRDRPQDKEAQADEEHRKFRVEGSDFLSLLQIWKAYSEQYENWSQSRMRRFCRDHFISYQRLREWREIHAQISDVLRDLDVFRKSGSEETPDAIHRSILSGLLGNVAVREDGNWFQATKGRKVMVFPGSAVFEKNRKKDPRKTSPSERRQKDDRKDWIMAAEYVETSRLFARTVSRIDVRWIKSAAAHLIRHSYQEPHWSSRSQRVLVWCKDYLYGLLIDRTQVGFGPIDPAEAKNLFIRLGILEDGIRDTFPFLEHNRKVCETVSEMQARFRRSIVSDLDTVLFEFYHQKLPELSSVAELHKWWRGLSEAEQKGLFLDQAALVGRAVRDDELEAFPEEVDLGGCVRRIQYRFAPGEAGDGATLSIPLSSLAAVREGSMDWLVPGYVAEKVDALLKTLPKEIRQRLMPLRDTRDALMRELRPSPRSLPEDLSRAVRKLFRLNLPPAIWDTRVLPGHLQLKLQVVDEQTGEVVVPGCGRWQEIREQTEAWMASHGRKAGELAENQIWKEAADIWEQAVHGVDDLKDLPRELLIGNTHGIDIHAYPGLAVRPDGQVAVRLFTNAGDADRNTLPAWRRLCEDAVGRETGWFERDLKKLKPTALLIADAYPWQSFEEDISEAVKRQLFLEDLQWPLTRAGLQTRVSGCQIALRSMVFTLEDQLKPVFEARLELMRAPYVHAKCVLQTLDRLFPKRFLRVYTLAQIRHFARYLKAVRIRVDRALIDPRKDEEKAARIVPFVKDYNALIGRSAKDPGISRAALNRIFIAMEELRVSVFAQELGTNGKISEKILREMMQALG